MRHKAADSLTSQRGTDFPLGHRIFHLPSLALFELCGFIGGVRGEQSQVKCEKTYIYRGDIYGPVAHWEENKTSGSPTVNTPTMSCVCTRDERAIVAKRLLTKYGTRALVSRKMCVEAIVLDIGARRENTRRESGFPPSNNPICTVDPQQQKQAFVFFSSRDKIAIE